MKFKLLSILLLCVCLSAASKTLTQGNFLFTTLDDYTCKVEQADPTAAIYDRTLDIPASVEIDGRTYAVVEIPDNGFKCQDYNYDVTEINLPEGLVRIGSYAFENYTGIKELTIPNSVSSLGEGAFKQASKLKTVTIGSGITSLPANLFERAGNIDNLNMRPTTPPTLDPKAFPYPMFITVTVPNGTRLAYLSAPNWDKFSKIIEDSTEVIEVPMPEIKLGDDNMVTITCPDPRAEIHYTFGTAHPTRYSALYTAPFKLEKASIVRAVAFIGEFESFEAYATLEPVINVALPNPFYVFLNGHPAWGPDRVMSWHSLPIATDGESSRTGDILGAACVWAEPAGDLLYMETYDTFTETPVLYLTTYDRGTMEFVGQEKFPSGLNANDVAVDPITGNIYGVFANSGSEPHSFGYINLETKTRTEIGKYDLMYNSATVDRVMAFCFSPDGVPYALTFRGRLVKFDRETGAYTIVGETKWNINYVSSARWDEKSGKIVYAFSDQDGKHFLYTIDPETADRNPYMELPGSVSAFYAPGDYVNPKAPAAALDVTLSFTEGSRTGLLSFKAPELASNGDELSGTLTYRIVRKGKTVSQGTVRPGAFADVNLTSTAEGLVSYSVVLSNNYGESLRVPVSAFAGLDVPATPIVKAEKKDNGILVSWQPVTTGADGGHIEAADVTYTVVRFPAKETVASGLTDTSFTDAVPEMEEDAIVQYWYTVTAKAGDKVSASGKSNKIVYGYKTPTWKEDFSNAMSMDDFTIINTTEYAFDETNFSGWQYSAYGRNAGAFYHPYSDMDDWLITPPLMMEKDKLYRLSFKAGSNAGRLYNYLEVAYGNDNTIEAMTNILMEKFNVPAEGDYNPVLKEFSVDIVPSETGLQYIGFHCLSQPKQLWLYLDDIAVLEGVEADAPKSVEDLNVEPDQNGRTVATVSFTLPTLTIADQTIAQPMGAQIKRGDNVIHTVDGLEPGSKVTYEDQVGEHGSRNYTIRAFIGDKAGMESLVNVYVGNTRPNRIESVTAHENPAKIGEVTIEWEAPEKDEYGRNIAPENLTYEIAYAWADGRNGKLAEGIQGTSYTYTPTEPTEKEMFVTYQVTPVTPAGKSNVYTHTLEQTPVGPATKAPWKESFNSNTPQAPLGISIISGYNGCGWDVYNDSEGITAQDNDNCFGTFVGFQPGHSGSLYTGKLDLSTLSDNPMLTFWVYRWGSDDINTLECLAGAFGEWEALDYISMDQLQDGWNEIVIPMSDYAGEMIQLKWIATVNYYGYVLLDNIALGDTSGVGLTDGMPTPVSSRFFTLDGIEISAPAPGQVCIMVTVYNDGSVKRNKLMQR